MNIKEAVQLELDRNLSNSDVMKSYFIYALSKVERQGMSDLIAWLETTDFFTAPASTRFHGSYAGGLLEHSINVHVLFDMQLKTFNQKLSSDSIAIISLLHDLCKIGLYQEQNGIYIYNKSVANLGHAKRSIALIEQYIELTAQEKNIIKYHMGFFNAVWDYCKEYSIEEYLEAVKNDPLIMLFHHCDDEESKFMGCKQS